LTASVSFCILRLTVRTLSVARAIPIEQPSAIVLD
jgi:hypothetical protein